jgi:hypothetical protein
MHITYFLTILSAIAPLVVSAIPATRSNTYAGEKCDLNACHKCISHCPLGCMDPMQHAVCLSHCRMFPFSLCYEDKGTYYKGRRNVNEKQMLNWSNTRYDVRRGYRDGILYQTSRLVSVRILNIYFGCLLDLEPGPNTVKDRGSSEFHPSFIPYSALLLPFLIAPVSLYAMAWSLLPAPCVYGHASSRGERWVYYRGSIDI